MDYSSLPNEVLEKIFLDKVISIADLGRLMTTCKRFEDFIRNSDPIWKQMFMLRYVTLKNYVECLICILNIIICMGSTSYIL